MSWALIEPIRLLVEMWIFYVVGITVLRNWDILPLGSKVLGFFPLLYAYLLDVVLNWTLLSVLFMDRARERTITERLHRYQATEPNSKRARVARFVCVHLLNPFDPDHC